MGKGCLIASFFCVLRKVDVPSYIIYIIHSMHQTVAGGKNAEEEKLIYCNAALLDLFGSSVCTSIFK